MENRKLKIPPAIAALLDHPGYIILLPDHRDVSRCADCLKQPIQDLLQAHMNALRGFIAIMVHEGKSQDALNLLVTEEAFLSVLRQSGDGVRHCQTEKAHAWIQSLRRHLDEIQQPHTTNATNDVAGSPDA